MNTPRASGPLRPLLVLAVLAAGWGTFAAADWKLPSERNELVAGPGREVVAVQCVLCHSTDYISTQPRLTRGQWQAIVDKMRARYGAPLPTNQVSMAVDYLTAGYGRAAAP